MVTVAILPVPSATGEITYRAAAGDKQSQGNTAGQALDALTSQLAEDEAGTLVIVQNHRPDRFFDAAHQARLAELMARWRAARHVGAALSAAEQAELEALVDDEVGASARRAAALLHDLER